jgi:RHS repeat-associated protein
MVGVGVSFAAVTSARASIDADADGFTQPGDCNDGNAQVWGTPGEALQLQFGADKRTVSWAPPTVLGGTGTSVRYDTLRSTSPSNFASTTASQCQDPEGVATTSNDPAIPPPGTAFYYLVRAKNDCGDATLGVRSGGTPRVGLACDCSVLCDDGVACTRDRCSDGLCAHDTIAPAIAASPSSSAACPGDPTLFTVRASGQGTLHYQWKKGVSNVGTDSSSLTLPVTAADDGAQISCVVSDSCASSPSAPATITVFPSAASCSGGSSGLEAPNGASDPPATSKTWGDKVSLCHGTASQSNPLGRTYLFSGEFALEANDLVIEGRGFDFVWSRKYRSREGRLTTIGNGWDFSYNRSIAVDSLGNLIVADGSSRRDTYVMGTSGCWTATGFFREACPQPDGTIVLTFPDHTTWTFASLDGSPAEGKLSRIEDSNTNAMTFAYDTSGRLTTIIDTLGRPITVSYNPAGYVAALTDFGGRQVTYDYGTALDTEGLPGDLRSVTNPAGKTTTYGYTKGMPQTALDHNLLTITDATGAVVLRNVFAPVTDPGNPRFDRLDRQVLPNGTIDFVYVAHTPDPTDESVTRTIVRDRAGNVREISFDGAHRVTKLVEFTGRAPSTSLPTDDTTNRPTGQLRPTDPSSFTTQFAWTADSLLSFASFPEGDAVACTYDSANANMRQRINLLEATLFPGPRGGDQPVITESWTYATSFGSEPCTGGGCGGGPVFAKVPRSVLKEYFQTGDKPSRFSTYHDGLGHTWSQDIDSVTGNVLSLTAPPVFTGTGGMLQLISESWSYNTFGQVVGHTDPTGRYDQYSYATGGPTKGYLHDVTVDASGAALFTVTARDQYGNLTARTDPRGNTETFAYDPLDKLLLHVARPEGDVQTSFDYDAAGRIIGMDVKNADETGAVETNALTSTFYYYDPLGQLVKTRFEPDTVSIETEYVYDANGHVTLLRRPEAVNGHQPTNVVRSLYDERDLLFRRTIAESDPQAATTQWDYDGNGNLAAVRQGLESAPRVTTYAWDGYDRSRQTTAMDGTISLRSFDACNNTIHQQTEGELIEGSSGPNIRLSERTFLYDEVKRIVQIDDAAFDLTNQNPLYEDGSSMTNVLYDASSRVLRVQDDNGNGTVTAYDSVGRVASTTDARGNVRTFGYDGNGNVTTVTETELSDLSTSPPQDFVTTLTYDNLDRLTNVTNPADDTEQNLYDSRGHKTVHFDARGNKKRFVYDGAGRLSATALIMTETGYGGAGQAFVLDATKSHDDGFRLLSETDDNGNTTTYQYDALDRLQTIVHPDGTSETTSYDVHGNPVQVVDANGTVTTAMFDLANRVVTRSIVPAPGVLGTTAELWKYDGTGRVVYAENDISVVTRQYDSLSSVLQESLTVGAGPTRTLTSTYDGARRRVAMTYPSGLTIETARDGLDRTKTIATAGLSAPSSITYDYAGPDRLVRRQCCTAAPNEELDVVYDAARRVSRTTHRKMIPVTIPDDRVYTWDPTGNKTSRTQLGSLRPGESSTFAYDSASRMGHSATVLPGSPPVAVDYTLDGVGNRVLLIGGADDGNYAMSATLPEPADRQVNQYTTTPFGGPREYDKNGNTLRKEGQITHANFDLKNRLISAPIAGGTRTFGYDAMGRGIAVDCRSLFWDGDRKIEERDCSGNLAKAYVYGPGGDVVIAVADVDGDGALDRSAYHADDLGNITMVTDGNGDVLESYSYDDYGNPHVFDAGGSPIAVSAIGNDINFGGQRYDAELGLYDFRTRFYDPRVGRFISRDSVGAWGDPGSLGNGNAYANNNPHSLSDPTGMAEQNRSYLHERFQDGDIPTGDDFFQTGDKPTQPQFSTMLDSMVNFVDDRDFIGLREYNPALSYVTGDTAIINQMIYQASGSVTLPGFHNGDVPTQRQFAAQLDSMVNFVDDRDFIGLREYNPALTYVLGDTAIINQVIYQATGSVTPPLSGNFFEGLTFSGTGTDSFMDPSRFHDGDVPTQSQFAALIDSLVHRIEDRYLLGLKTYDPTKPYLPGDTVIFGGVIY